MSLAIAPRMSGGTQVARGHPEHGATGDRRAGEGDFGKTWH